MRFHAPSFLLGVGVTATVVVTRDRLRPVAVELGALGLHLGRLGRSLVEREREELEDLWAEVEARVRERVRAEKQLRAPFGGNGQARAREAPGAIS
jgi:hypothetical protein